MATFPYSEEPDEMSHSALFANTKQYSEKDMQFYLKIITFDPSTCTMGHPKFIVSSQEEESLSIQSVNSD